MLRFLCVLQSLILNPGGSPNPGAFECLINIILSPFFAGFQLASAAWVFKNKKKKIIKDERGTMFLIMVDEKKV